MPDFNLPAGCTMHITASMETASANARRWSVAIFPAAAGDDDDAKARYGARIVGGQIQKIDTPAINADCICRVVSSSQTDGDWLEDLAKVSPVEDDELTMTFARPQVEDAPDAGGDCVMTFRFNPALAHA